jgi:hypothetical protein
MQRISLYPISGIARLDAFKSICTIALEKKEKEEKSGLAQFDFCYLG